MSPRSVVRSFVQLFSALALTLSAHAQSEVEAPAIVEEPYLPMEPGHPVSVISIGQSNQTALQIRLGGYFPIYTTTGIIPVDPAPATYISPGTAVTLSLSDELGAVSNINWYHNGALLLSDSPQLEITSFTRDQNGSYSASFTGNPDYSVTNTVQLTAGTADRQRLANQSSRITLSPTSPSATFGFVITPRAAGSTYLGQPVLIRIIGPGLADFGVSNPLADPVYTLRNSQGTDLTPGQVFTADIVNGKTAEQRYRDSVDTLSSQLGAFPVVTDLQSGATPRNLADIAYLTAGAYTVTVSSASGATGEVLVEIYDAWQDPTD